MAGHPLGPATRRRLGRPLPYQLADRPRSSPSAQPCGCCPRLEMPPGERMRYYPAVGPAIPHRWTNSSRVTHPFATGYCYPVRLACVRHAASVRPEPGSNSPMSSIQLLVEQLDVLSRPNHRLRDFVSSPGPPLVRTRIEGPALHPDSPFTSLVKELEPKLPVLREPSKVNWRTPLVKGCWATHLRVRL